jgi:hypothetical protein
MEMTCAKMYRGVPRLFFSIPASSILPPDVEMQTAVKGGHAHMVPGCALDPGTRLAMQAADHALLTIGSVGRMHADKPTFNDVRELMLRAYVPSQQVRRRN